VIQELSYMNSVSTTRASSIASKTELKTLETELSNI